MREGALASGKTTLLEHILTEQHGSCIAVIENELGAMHIDETPFTHRIEERADELIEIVNGRICCTVREV